MRNRRAVTALLILALAVGLAGCDTKTKKIAVAVDGFSIAMKHFQEAEIVAFEQGLVSHEDHRAIQSSLIRIASAQLAFDDVVRAGSTAGAQAVLDEALAEFRNLESVVFALNPKTRAVIEASLLTAKTFLATISAALN